MNLRKAEYFTADAEQQYEWYVRKAGWDVADRYLAAVAATCALLDRQPLLGPLAALRHPRLAGWRFFVLVRPFHRHVIFDEIQEQDLILRRLLHGSRKFPERLLEPPGTE